MNDYIPAEDVEAPFSVNFVTTSGYDRAQLTVRANDAVQLVARLAELETNEALDRIVEYNKALQDKAQKAGGSAPAASSNRSSGGNRSGGGGGNRQQSQGSDEVQTHPEGITCKKCDGAVTYKKIKSAAGKTFELWTCENQRARNDGHHSEFIN